MIPVPAGAARRTTRPAPCRPLTSWCSVRPSRSGTRTTPRFAASVALRIASGTSRALPWPKPTRPFWSPTTTSAAKPKRRPPFTTFATRLICTRRSTNSLSRSSRLRSRPRPPSPSRAIRFIHQSNIAARSGDAVQFGCFPSKVQAALAGAVGKRFDAPVIHIAAAVEHHFVDAGLLGPLGEFLADALCGLDGRASLHRFAQRLFERGGGRNSVAPLVVDDLSVDLLRGAKNAEPRATARMSADRATHASFASIRGGLGVSHAVASYFFLPSLRKMNSPAYFTPFP